MSAKITAFAVTFLINIAIGVVVFFFLLIAMNGFSESDATYGLGAYILLALIVTILMSISALLVTSVLMRRSFRGSSAALISIPIFSAVGVGLKVVCSIIGLMIAEYVRVNY